MRRSDRRGFLRDVLAMGVAPLVVPSSVLAGPAAPSNRITIAQVGLGWIGGSHLGAMLGRDDVQYLGVCDINRERAESVRDRINRQYGERIAKEGARACVATGDYRELLARPDLDAMIVATPDHWHGPISCAAARAGKDIYCEKPLALTIREGREVVETVRRYGRVFQTGSQQRSNTFGPFRNAAELVRNGRIGKVVSIDVSTGDPPKPCDLPPEPVPAHIDWETWVGQTPWRPYHSKLVDKSWRPYREYCAGGFGDMGAHHFDIAQWALGMDETGPIEVLPPDPAAGRARVQYRYASGIIMNHVGGNSLGLTFTGTAGRLYIGRDGFWTDPAELKREPLGAGAVRLYESNNHHGNWIDCIRSRRLCVADVEAGHRTATVCHLGNLAYELGRPLTWDPLREEFPGDAAANRYLERARRAGVSA